MLSCCFLDPWMLSGCLICAVALVLLRMLFAAAYVVEYVVEYVVGFFVGYLASCWLLLVAVGSRLRSGCLIFAVAVALLRKIFAVAYVLEYVVDYVVCFFVGLFGTPT
jgi:hypothetical protein